MRKKLQSGCTLMLAAVVFLLLAPVNAVATSILPQDISVLSAESTHVVRGTVRSLNSRWNDDKTLIVTDVRLGVDESFKGQTKDEIVLTVVGGRVDDLVLDVVGAPSFAIDEDVLVFMKSGDGKSFRLPSLSQSKYHLSKDAADETWVSNEQYSLRQAVPQRAAAVDGQERLPWQAFVAELRVAISGSQGGVR